MNTLLEIAVIINDRYRIVRQLGQGGFSRTYLTEDTHRFDELCVLKEFSPQNQSLEIGQKAEELFEREAKILYKLKHPQITQFRAIFRLLPKGLFLVQDYIEGQSYRELLNLRLKEEKTYTEAEMLDLLEKILPVLDYLHSGGIIHRDIAPDNLIYRYLDQLPILIDFGSVKQISLETSQNGHHKTPIFTQLGKKGYSPDEQIEEGRVFPNSDLYALAVTILVLLTGKEPSLLKDNEQWQMPEEAILSAKFKQILTKMLSKQPSDRFQSAQEVLTSLKKTEVQFLEAQPTIIVAPALPTPTPETTILTPDSKSNPILGCLGKILLVLTIILGSGLLGWIGGKLWLKQILSVDKNETPQQVFTPSPSPQDNPVDPEWQRQEAIRTRRQQLDIDNQFFQKLVDQVFLSQYPQQENTLEDEQWQEKRDLVAQKLLDQLSSLSDEARQGLGNYDQQQRNAWKQEVNQLHLSSRALYDLADAAFFKEFPEQENEQYSEQPIGQVWSAIVLDTLKALQSGEVYEEVSLSEATQHQETLEPGQGKAYVVRLSEGQILELKLEADQYTFLSVYSPTGNNNLLEDSTIDQWYGILPESGYYEIIIVSKSEKTLNYQLNFQIFPSE